MVYVIGLMSGTSVDGIDAALVNISGTDLDIQVELIAGATIPYPMLVREKILAVCAGQAISMMEFAELDDAIAIAFSQAAQTIQQGHPQASLIGSHGQTVFHRPAQWALKSLIQVENNLKSQMGYSLQLGAWGINCEFNRCYNYQQFSCSGYCQGRSRSALGTED